MSVKQNTTAGFSTAVFHCKLKTYYQSKIQTSVFPFIVIVSLLYLVTDFVTDIYLSLPCYVIILNCSIAVLCCTPHVFYFPVL